MDITKIKNLIDESKGFETLLGMEFLSTPEDDTCMARMAVDKRTTQPFGFLSGGASVALAETLAGVASCSLCPDSICVGMNISANHVSSARFGDTVTAKGRLLHRGKSTHVWQIDVISSVGSLISSVSVTNHVRPK